MLQDGDDAVLPPASPVRRTSVLLLPLEGVSVDGFPLVWRWSPSPDARGSYAPSDAAYVVDRAGHDVEAARHKPA